MIRERVRELINQGDALFGKRYPIMSLWQQGAENFHVMRADFTRPRYLSEEFASYLMTGRPALAHRDLANSLPALMRPRDRQWLWARTHDERINGDREARGYLDWMSRGIYRALYEQRSGFVRSCKELDGDYCAFGQGVLTIDPNEWQDGVLVRCWHLRDVVWTEGHDLKINAVHHRRKITVRDICKLWPKTASPLVTSALKEEPDREINCRRFVVPSKEYDLKIKNTRRFPFVSVYVDIDNDTLLEETPSRVLSYVIPRWATISGSQYAYSPAVVYGLPDARMLQQVTLTMLEAGQKATDPPMIAVTEAINGGVNSGAGMITWTDSDYDERTGEVLRPMEMRFDGIRFGAEREDKIAAILDSTFFLNQLRMPQVTKDMTAYEASKLYEEFARNSLPLLEPIEVEYNGGICGAAFETMLGIGMFGRPEEMPEILRGEEIRWDFDTPLKAAAETAKVFAYQAMTDTLAKGMQIDPDIRLNVDMNRATREAVIGNGGADWLVSEDQAAQARQQQAQQRQAAQQADAMAHGADVASKLATAAESAGNAGAAMRQSGMM